MIRRILTQAALLLIQCYQRIISPIKPASCTCRFLPTCSHYAKQAILKHGIGKGCWLSVKRICRCHPWGGNGIDEVPE